MSIDHNPNIDKNNDFTPSHALPAPDQVAGASPAQDPAIGNKPDDCPGKPPCKGTTLEERIIKALKRKRRRLIWVLDANGGRGIELADDIDRLGFAIDALNGELFCPHCEEGLTGC